MRAKSEGKISFGISDQLVTGNPACLGCLICHLIRHDQCAIASLLGNHIDAFETMLK